MDIKEIVNLLYTAIDLAADGGPTAFTDEEYSEMHELLNKIKSGQLGWHPASELPPLDEDGCSDEVVVITSEDNDTFRHGPMVDKPSTSMVIDKEWDNPNVKWWCYSPKKD